MVFNVSKKTQYMYKYMIGFLFLNFAIYSDIHYCINSNILKYSKIIKFISLLMVIYISSIDIPSGILLAISIVLFDNIITIKQYLRELFINYYEYYSNYFRLTSSEIQQVKNYCEKNNWSDNQCSQIKKNIISLCMQYYPWRPIILGSGKERVTLNCPEFKKYI